jgi:hypothetical protein
MANNYLEFSEVLPQLTAEEEAWLREQLERVHVIDGREYPENALPEGVDVGDGDSWYGCRAWRDLETYDSGSDDPVGFDFEFHDDEDNGTNWGRHLWLYAVEWGNLEQVLHLVRKFLKRFRPEQSGGLTYALSCSKPRAGEFGGGGYLVTAEEATGMDGHEFVERQGEAFAASQARRAAVKGLLERAEAGGLEPEALDELIHDAAATTAAAINNGGLQEQIEYLVDRFGVEDASKTLDGLLAGPKEQ